MKLPSGQVIWVRVEDDDAEHYEPEDEAPDEDDSPDSPPPPPMPEGGYGGPPSAPGASGGYGAAPAPAGAPYGSAPSSGDSSADAWTPGAPPPPPGLPAGAPGSAPGAPPPIGSTGPGRFARRRKRSLAPSVDDAQQIQGFTDAVSGIAESVRDSLAHAAPDKVEIEFGLDIDFSSGIAVSLIADARAKAAVKITLGWDNSERRERREQRGPERYDQEPSSETVLATPQYAWSDSPRPNTPPPAPMPPVSTSTGYPSPPPNYAPQPQPQNPYYGSPSGS
ncbi:hypothetical protein KDK95_10740 [Actinospica sp. MGRD01-02]|uniref:Trypsin-co-occurring domain-containing protein n=1 Tax=Actinospica acidithermotolerans TaxID=2828514 RepID=A0A941EAN8_9ACTN|nr:CU044_2847 family protein [Actinospica acidithermotolerans]MBR7826780.1 hypothetical protein [Actinospica acidithermotolerans]